MAVAETFIVNLRADPINLVEDARAGVPEPSDGVSARVWVQIQNTGSKSARWKEGGRPGTGETYHKLKPDATALFCLDATRPLWLWSAAGTTLAVSEGGPQQAADANDRVLA